jgi:putative serine protease PepD
VTTVQSVSTGIANVTTNQLTVGEIAKQDTQGVVEIVATSTSPNASPYPYGQRSTEQAEGSGFFYDSAGHIVTNEHVVSGATSVKVTLADGKSYSATVVGSDASSDLAVLKISAPSSEIHPLPFGDSSIVSVGDGVVAIGDPFGLAGTVTSGIVSALGREISATNGAPIENTIQTDAAINHGNSGGPLIDLHGDVIGITSQIESDSGGNDGIGFAIPSDTVKSVVDQLIASGKVEHAFLGVSPQTVAGTGVRVTAVNPASAAAKSGLKVGDVITAVNGKATLTSAGLRAAVDLRAPGDKVKLTVRNSSGSTRTVTVTLGTRPS